ncbi:hypothetical protein N7G274_003807 [Stereocaulon virgatum]|uniref:Uncharacterized protein n=1 Tax=Stereocaulon virgatum TaxID=373712 RepID=A0ABR4AEE9_9LECA
MEALAKHVEQLAMTADAAARQRLLITLRDLAYSLEDSNDTLNRIGYLHLQMAIVRIGFDMEIFQFMAKTETAVSVRQLVEVTGADPIFISTATVLSVDAAPSYMADNAGRCMIYFATVGAVKETGEDMYFANSVTRKLSEKMTEAGICH